MRKFSNLSKLVFLTVILLITYTGISAPAPYIQPPIAAPTTPRRVSAQEKKQQLQQEAATASTELSTKYQEILSHVNSAQAPSDPNLKEFLKIAAKNRKYLPVFNDSQKSTYLAFSAWVFYFDNKLDKAVKQAASAQKVSPKNQNSIKTRFALSLLYKDYTSAIESLSEQSPNNRPGPQTAKTEEQPYQQGAEPDIQLDVNAVRIAMLGKVLDFHPEPLEANQPSWQSAGRLVCALLWKLDANELDSFAPPEVTKPAETNEPNAPPREPNAPQPVLVTMPEPQYQAKQMPEFEVFSKLQNQFSQNKKIVLTGINLNDLTKTKNLANWLSKNPQAWQTFVLSAEQQEKMFLSLGDGFDKPVLLIVAPDSTIRYAGSVEGFLPQMVIHNIMQNPQEFAPKDSNEPNQPFAEPNLPAVEPVRHIPAEPNKLRIAPVLPTADVNKTVINTQRPQTAPAPNTVPPQAKLQQNVDEDFFDPQAEDLINHARAFLKINNVLPNHMYRDPIEWCRRVRKDYPNTKYAREAQMLLRNVPERYRQQYNLTDEELGI
jgi:hypothetical protein